jgi:hypothetical protein
MTLKPISPTGRVARPDETPTDSLPQHYRDGGRESVGNALPNDFARCNGVKEEGEWREGCDTCLRRTAPRPEMVTLVDPPTIIAFECEYLIEP